MNIYFVDARRKADSERTAGTGKLIAAPTEGVAKRLFIDHHQGYFDFTDPCFRILVGTDDGPAGVLSEFNYLWWKLPRWYFTERIPRPSVGAVMQDIMLERGMEQLTVHDVEALEECLHRIHSQTKSNRYSDLLCRLTFSPLFSLSYIADNTQHHRNKLRVLTLVPADGTRTITPYAHIRRLYLDVRLMVGWMLANVKPIKSKAVATRLAREILKRKNYNRNEPQTQVNYRGFHFTIPAPAQLQKQHPS